MNQIKRQFSCSRTSDVSTKKLRINSCIEHFSNELFYEIFDYLDGCDLNKAFSKLNIRFQNLLNRSLIPLKISLDWKSQSTLEHSCQHIIIPNKHRIISLHLRDDLLINDFFNHCNIDSSFDRLESVVVNELSVYKLMMVLFYLNSLPRLFSLTIQLAQDYYRDLSDIYRLIFRLSHLKYNKLSLLGFYNESNILMPMSINEKFSSIQHLVLSHCCTLNELTSILHHTPHLRHLICEHLIDADETTRTDVLLTLPNLTYVSIIECSIEFDKFETLITKISSQLQTLRLATFWQAPYLNGNRWKRLINQYMPHLCKFHFDHHMSIDDDDENVTPNCESIHQFTSSFWIDRQWFFELKNSFDEFIYSIHPYREKWFNCHVYNQNTSYQNQNFDANITKNLTISDQLKVDTNLVQFVSSIELTLGSFMFTNEDQPFIEKIKPCLIAVQFTHLDMECNKVPIGILIEIIRLLPNLNSLKVSSLPHVQLSYLSIEDTEMLLLVSITNKITKVKLNKLDGMEQLQFLMNLCPRMQYLEIEYTTDNDLESIIGFISMNNITRIPYLCCLCLCIPNANEKGIQILDTVIDFERLFHRETAFRDYEIRRVQDRIFLKWKL